MGRQPIPLTFERLKNNCSINEKTGCWEWQKCLSSNGYGAIHSGTSPTILLNSHVAMFQVIHGPVPKGMVVMHTCDNKPCCNPDHLRLGTYLDNIRDAFDKGIMPQGEKHSLAKLTSEQVLEIYSLRNNRPRGLLASLGRKYGVDRMTIKQIMTGKNWKSVTQNTNAT